MMQQSEKRSFFLTRCLIVFLITTISLTDAQSFTCSVGSGGACPVAFCPGDEVTHTCDVGTVMGTTQWTLPNGTCGSRSVITLAQSGVCSDADDTCGPFSAANDGNDGTNCLVSSLTVTTSTDLNNTLIQCTNVDLSNNPTEVGSTTLYITGPPPPPTGVSVASCTAAGSVTLVWEEPTVTGGLPIIYYLSFSPPVGECTSNCTVVGLPMFTTSLPGELSYAVSISAANCGGTLLGDTAVYMLDSSNFLSVQVATSNEITTATCSFLSGVKTDVRCRVDYGTSPDSLEYSATSQQMGSAGGSVTVELTLNGAALMEDTVYYYQATLVSLECVVIGGQFTITDCTVPDVSSISMLNYTVDGLMPGSTITYFCDGDYYLPDTVDTVQECLQSGEWSGSVPTACVKDCPSLCQAGGSDQMIPGGVLSCTGLTPGSTDTVSCEDGYELSGEVVCQDDGTWSGPTPTCGKVPGGGLSTGAIIGIVVGVLLLLLVAGAITGLLVWCCCCRDPPKKVVSVESYQGGRGVAMEERKPNTHSQPSGNKETRRQHSSEGSGGAAAPNKPPRDPKARRDMKESGSLSSSPPASTTSPSENLVYADVDHGRGGRGGGGGGRSRPPQQQQQPGVEYSAVTQGKTTEGLTYALIDHDTRNNPKPKPDRSVQYSALKQ